MNSILSEMIITAAEREAPLNLDARQRAALAREASSHRGPAPGSLSRLAMIVANAIRQWVDPRSYAMALLERRDPSATQLERLPEPRVTVHLEPGLPAHTGPSGEASATLPPRRCLDQRRTERCRRDEAASLAGSSPTAA